MHTSWQLLYMHSHSKQLIYLQAWIDLYYDPKVDYLPEPTLQILVGVVANVMGGNYRGLAKKIAGRLLSMCEAVVMDACMQ